MGEATCPGVLTRHRVARSMRGLATPTIVAAAMALGTTPVHAGDELPPMTAFVDLRVDEAVVFTSEGDAKSTPDGLGVIYGREVRSPDGTWIVTYALQVMHDTTENGLIEGYLRVENIAGETRRFEYDFTADGCPQIVSDCAVGGDVDLTLFVGEGGGTMFVPGDLEGFEAKIDGETVATVFSGPFFLQGSGMGSISVDDQYGWPPPSLEVAPMTRDFGFSVAFDLTPGETVLYVFDLVVGGPASGFEPCSPPAAVAGDPVDGPSAPPWASVTLEDLIVAWGTCGHCPADLTHDGRVDHDDLVQWMTLGGGVAAAPPLASAPAIAGPPAGR